MKLRTIRSKLSLIFILTISAITVIFSGVLYYEFGGIIRNQVDHDLSNVMATNAIIIGNLLSDLDRAALFVSADRIIIDILNRNGSDSLQDISDIKRLNEQFKWYVDIPLRSSFSQYSAVLFINGSLPFAHLLPPGDKLPGDTFYLRVLDGAWASRQPWYGKARDLGGRPYWFVQPDTPSIIYRASMLTSPLLHAVEPFVEEMGTMVIGIDIEKVGKYVETSRITPGTQIAIVDPENRVLYATGAEVAVLVSDLTGGRGPTEARPMRGSLVNVQRTQFGWGLFAFVPLRDITTRMLGIVRLMSLALLAAIAAGAVLSAIISSRVTNPIRTLASALSSIKDKDLTGIFLPPPSRDEIGALYEDFNTMVKRIGFLLDEVYELGKRQKEGELKVHEAQINPHFLYNTLDSVCWMALAKKEETIAQMLSSLSSMFRYSIKNPEGLVMLSDEVRHVRAYVTIQKTRMNNSFDVFYDIPEGLLPYKLPKFLLQPLVENALVHGIVHADARGRIEISAAMDGGLTIVVSDNGNCADADALNAYLAGEKTAIKDSDGFGIMNVHQRIRMNFDERYGLRYQRRRGCSEAVLSLPLVHTAPPKASAEV